MDQERSFDDLSVYTKAYVVATVDSERSWGEMDVYVDGHSDGGQSKPQQPKVYETPDLAAGSHHMTLVNSKGDTIATEGI